MEREVNLNGSNGLIGEYTINSICLDKINGSLSVGYVYAPYIITNSINIVGESSIISDTIKRQDIYKKRKNIVDKLLDEFF
jgi:hypothetical protein